MADRSVKYILGATVSGFVGPIKSAQGAVKNLNSELMRNEQAAREVTTGLGLIGAAAVAGAGVAVKTYASFDKQMSAVKATGGATAAEMNRLRDAAIDAGAATAFSASEAAAGVENLLKAGVSAQDVLGGGLTGALDLAASGELAVADAAEIAATAMTQFKLGGEDMTHVADLLAAGAGKAQGDVTDLAQALQQGGLVASQTGLSIEETTGALSAFAAAGLLGSDAGTSFKTMLQRLSAPSGEAANLMEELGIHAYDAAGQFVGMTEFAGQLEQALGDMTPAQRNAALATIFGADAVRAAAVVYDQGESGIRDWISAVDDQGYSAKTAAARLDNLAGDLEALGGSFETALIQSGGAANDVLREIAQGATAVVNEIGQIDSKALGGLTLLVGTGGLIALGVAGMGKLVIGVNNAKTSLSALGVSARVAGVAVGGVGAAIGAASIGLVAWADNAAEAQARTDALKSTLDNLGNTTDATLASLNETLASPNEINLWEKIFGAPKENDSRSAFEMADQLKIATEDVTLAILGQADAQDRVNRAIEAARNNDSLWDTSTRSAAASLTKIIDEQSMSLQQSTTEKQRESAANAALGASQEDAAAATELFTEATQQSTEAREAAAEELEEFYERATGAFSSFISPGGAFQAAIDKNKEFAEKTAEATEDAEDSWEDYYDGQSVSSEDYIGQLRRQVRAQENWRDNMISLSERVNEKLPADMRDAANEMIDELMDLGPEGAAQVEVLESMSDKELAKVVRLYGRKGEDASKEFADEVNSHRPDPIPIEADTTNALKSLQLFRDAAEEPMTTTVNGRVVFDFAANGRANGFGNGDGEGAGWTGQTPRGVSQMSAAVQAMDPSAQITSGYRPGAITATGFPSYHGMGRAVDIVSGDMGRTFDMLASAFGPKAKELYYTPRGFIRNGQWTNDVADVTRRTHVGHIHMALAKGGAVRGPGTGTSDDVPIWASNGEHMWTEREVNAVGGHAAMYRLRAAALDGEFTAYKDGGAVGAARRELEAAKRARRNAKGDRAKDRARERVDAARDRLDSLRQERRDFRVDRRRGDLLDSATSSLSGAYGVVDEMFGLARSGTLGGKRSDRLENRAERAEKAMRKLYKQAEGVEKRLEKARDNLAELADIKASVGSALAGEQSLAAGVQAGAWRDVVRTNARGETWTEQMWDAGRASAKGLVADARAKASSLKAFAGKLAKLRKAGMSPAILQEITDAGSQEGSILADAFLADRGQIDDLNAAYRSISKHSKEAGTQVAESFGLSAARSLVEGLSKQDAKLEKQIRNWGVYMADGMSQALTGKKSGLKKRAMGGPVSAGELYLTGEQGPELIVPRSNGYVLTAEQTRNLAATAPRAHSAPAASTVSPVTVHVDNITTLDADAGMRKLETRMRDSVVMHQISGKAGVMV